METKTPYQLRQEAAALEKSQEAQHRENQLKLANEGLLGKAFYRPLKQRDWAGFNCIMFTGFEIDTGFGRLRYKSDSVNVLVTGKGGSRSKKSGGQLHAECGKYFMDFDNVSSICTYDHKPMSVDAFKQLYTRARLCAEAANSDLCKEVGLPILITYGENEEYLTEPDSKPVDIPYLQLEPYDAQLLPEQFMLPGHRYILTPLSRREGHKALNTESSHLNGGMAFYQECDMRHVSGRREQILRLSRLLTADALK